DLASLPELGETEEGRVDRDVGVLLVEGLNGLRVELGTGLVAPEREVEGDRRIGVEFFARPLAAAAATAGKHEGRTGDHRKGGGESFHGEHRCPLWTVARRGRWRRVSG